MKTKVTSEALNPVKVTTMVVMEVQVLTREEAVEGVLKVAAEDSTKKEAEEDLTQKEEGDEAAEVATTMIVTANDHLVEAGGRTLTIAKVSQLSLEVVGVVSQEEATKAIEAARVTHPATTQLHTLPSQAAEATPSTQAESTTTMLRSTSSRVKCTESILLKF